MNPTLLKMKNRSRRSDKTDVNEADEQTDGELQKKVQPLKS